MTAVTRLHRAAGPVTLAEASAGSCAGTRSS